MRKLRTEVTDWLWYDGCEICEAWPGEVCWNMTKGSTATVHNGRPPLRRPHKERRKLAERLIPFLSEEARAQMPEILRYLRAYTEFHANDSWSVAGKANKIREKIEYGMHVLGNAAGSVPTTRSTAAWPDSETASRSRF